MKFEILQKDMISAMKARDKKRKDAISSLISDIKKAAIDSGSDRNNIPDDLVDETILKSLKTAKEQLDTCPDDRTELKEEYQFRYDVINFYAPQLMDEEEVITFINEKFSDIIATKNKLSIMKAVMPELKGKADGKLISNVVDELCKD